ncbi:hypothetical protein ABFX02_11G008800 [Erythranthe guttata]
MASSSISPPSFILLLLYTLLFALPSTSYPLQNICRHAKNRIFCFKLLGPHPNASLQELNQIVIDTTISSVTKTASKIQSLLSKTEDPNLKIVYMLCSNYYSAALSALNAGKDKLKSGEYDDLNGAASTVSRDASSCQQIFTIVPSQPIPIASDNNDLDLLSNVFAVVSRLLSGSI